MTQLTEQLHLVLEKLGFVEPISPEIRRHIALTKQKQFKKTLNNVKGYTLLFGIISYIFFLLNRMRIKITIIQSAVLLAIGSLLISSIMVTLIYYSIQELIIEQKGAKEISKIVSPENILQPIEKIVKKAAKKEKLISRPETIEEKTAVITEEDLAVIQSRLGIKTFKHEVLSEQDSPNDTGENISKIITDNITKKLMTLRGNEKIVDYREGNEDKRVGMMLFGSVDIIEKDIIIRARIGNVKDARILYFTTETVKSQEEIDAACTRIAENIHSNIKE